MGQSELLRRVRVMDWGTVAELLERVAQVAPVARGGSRKAKVFAALRFLQEKGAVQHPRAFVEALARRTEAQIKGGIHEGEHGQDVDQKAVGRYAAAGHQGGA